MMQGSLPARLRVLRAERGLTLREAASLTGVRPGTLSELERGLRHPHDITLSRIAKGYGVPIAELLEEEPALVGKAEAPEAGQQRTATDALRSLMGRITSDYQRELEDPDNPDFRTATGAARWAERVRREAKRYADWVIEEGRVLLDRHAAEPPPLFGENEVFKDIVKIVGPIHTLNTLARKAEKRIEAMNDRPDELDQKRLEKARREAEESERRLSRELQAANG